MITRTIMIFPEYENIDSIDKIRSKYDPLADTRKFELTLHGFSKQVDEKFGNTLFLNVTQGYCEIFKLHDILYANEFRKFDLGFPYIPHITVGKTRTTEELGTQRSLRRSFIPYRGILDYNYKDIGRVDR